MALTVDFEAFFAWLASHRDTDVVGLPGRYFDSPLARWLSAQSGMVIGVDDRRYGWALADERYWCELPYWAQVFEAFSEKYFGFSLTAYETVALLVQVETVLSPVLAA